DNSLGTPAHALRLATTQGRQSKYYLITHEDLLVTTKDADGTTNPNVRCDITYFETDSGGAVFSLPAISASGSLSYNNYDNNVSKIINNVLERFTR
ncbi:MAG: N,N-dimethylformamidase beta subunit family domain-containing protein, partial [Ilumatobacteraceae bacterium]